MFALFVKSLKVKKARNINTFQIIKIINYYGKLICKSDQKKTSLQFTVITATTELSSL